MHHRDNASNKASPLKQLVSQVDAKHVKKGPTLLINRDDAVMDCIVAHCHNGRSVHLAAADGFVTARPHIKDVGLSCVLLSYCKL